MKAGIDKLIDMANEWFVDYYVQKYAGANYTCFYCGRYKDNGHEENCPVGEYLKIKEDIVSEMKFIDSII